MKIYKHHLSENIEKRKTPINGGIGKSATVFINFDYMVAYLKKDGRRWHYCEAEVDINDLLFNFKNYYMATIKIAYCARNYKKLH
jgi:hypothetical protein